MQKMSAGKLHGGTSLNGTGCTEGMRDQLTANAGSTRKTGQRLSECLPAAGSMAANQRDFGTSQQAAQLQVTSIGRLGGRGITAVHTWRFSHLRRSTAILRLSRNSVTDSQRAAQKAQASVN